MNILKKRYKEVALTNKLGISGEFKLWTGTETGIIIREYPKFNNMILNGGMAMMNTRNVPERISVGTGTSLEDPSQTALDNELYSTTDRYTNTWGYGATPDYHNFSRVVYRLAARTSPYNISEVGFGPAANLFSRALIRDMNGTPSSISVLADEFLYVQYILRVFHNQPPVTGTVEVKGNTHEYTLVPCGLSRTVTQMASRFPLISGTELVTPTRSISMYPTANLPATPLEELTPVGAIDMAQDNVYTSRSGYSVSWGASSAPGNSRTVAMVGSDLFTVVAASLRDKNIAVSFNPPITVNSDESFRIEFEASYAAV